MYCARYVEDYLPPFDPLWEEMKGYDKWIERIKEEYDYACEKSVVDLDRHPDIKDRIYNEAVEKIKYDAMQSYEYVVDFIKKEFGNKDTINVFRSMNVVDLDAAIDDLKKKGKLYYNHEWQCVGIYWAWDLEHAIGHWARSGDEIILEAVARCEDIDFEGTIEAFLIFGGDSEFDDELDENEIRLKPGREIFLERVYKNVSPEREKITEETAIVEMNRWICV